MVLSKIWGVAVVNEQDNHDRQRLDSSLVYIGAHNVYYVKLNGWLVCRFAVCRIFPALMSQAGKPRANEHPLFPSTFQTACGNESTPVSEMAKPQ